MVGGDSVSERVIPIINATTVSTVRLVVGNLPRDGTMEVVIRPHMKLRTKDQNRLFWGARLRDISQQAWVSGKQFSGEAWHEWLKREFLPEGDEQGFDKLVTKGYQKWAWLPNGERDCIGSTTKLTTLGMTRYMTECEAHCAQELGVRFSADRLAA